MLSALVAIAALGALALPAAAQAKPKVEPAPCVTEEIAQAGAECGVLVAPENRRRPEGRQVRIPFAVVRSTSPKRRPDPILHLGGGPGLAFAGFPSFYLDPARNGDRDIILMDQRGYGYGDPALDCARGELPLRLVTRAAPPAEEQADANRTMLACRDAALAAGVDLDQYWSGPIAEDIADLRRALGIRRWNVAAYSYGAMFALALMRERPAGLRSVVLNSPAINTAPSDSVGELLRAFAQARANLFAACASDTACHRAYPALERDYERVIAKLDRRPLRARVTGADGRPITLELDGADFAGDLYAFLDDIELLPGAPEFIARAVEGDYAQWLAFYEGLGPDRGGPNRAEVAENSIYCHDAGPFAESTAEVVALLEEQRFPVRTDGPGVCEAWGVGSSPKRFRRPVRSGVPTLVLTAEFDPIIPRDYGPRVARRLRRGQVVHVGNEGHVVRSGCANAIVRGFLDRPRRRVDRSCLATQPRPAWNIPAAR